MSSLDRRDFLKTTLAATAAATLTGAKAPAGNGSPISDRDLIELRAYRLKPGASSALLDSYLEKALIPALNARAIAAVGVFTEPDAKDGAAVWVAIPHKSPDSVIAVTASINAEPSVRAAAAQYLGLAKTGPAYDRIDSWLLISFSGQPRLAVPELARSGKPRVFEMRTYESFSEKMALKKVEMFNAGEIGLMWDLDLSPVFYGQGLVGRDLPHLTYLLCSPDLETHKKNWAAFLAHPIWLNLKNDPQYADTVSKVTSRFMVPKAYSQI